MSDGAFSGSSLWAPRAWLPGGWAEQVLLRIGSDGRWREVTSGVATPPGDAVRLQGPALPGLVDAHSHAFQRAFAGLAERRESDGAHDDFWSWRVRMYAVAGRITARCPSSSWRSFDEATPWTTPGVGPVQPNKMRRPPCRHVSTQTVAANRKVASIASRCSGITFTRGSHGSMRIARS